MPAILVSLKVFRSALLKFIESFYRSGRAFASRLYSETHRLLELMRVLFWVPSTLDFKEVDEHHKSSLNLFSSSPPTSSAPSGVVGCNLSLSERLRSTPISDREAEEESMSTGQVESVLKYEDTIYESALEDENTTEPPTGAVDIDDELSFPRVQCDDSDQENPVPRSPALVEGEVQVSEPNGISPPISYTPRLQPRIPRIRGTIPSHLQRYDRNIVIPYGEDEWEISTMLSASQFERQPREGWSLRTHPEGVLYHCAVIDDIRFSTDVNIYYNDAYEQIKAFTRLICHKLRLLRQEREVPDMKDSEIVLELAPDGTWEYYVADHRSRHLFWLEDYCFPSDIVGGIESLSHLKLKINSEYYLHLAYFPCDNNLPANFFDEMRGMITWALTDLLTSLGAFATYTEQTLESFLAIVNQLEALQEKAPAYAVASGARIRSAFEFERYYNYSGAPGARIDCYQSVRNPRRRPLSTIHQIISLILCQAPVTRLEALDQLYVDHQVRKIAFKSHATKVADSWTAEIINSAVLLNANIAYLAVPGILDNHGKVTLGSVASLISAIMSLCSIILGLLLAKRLKKYEERGTSQAAEFLDRWWDEEIGLFKLAVMFSLPFGFFMWGAIAFVVAMIFMAIEQFPSNSAFIILVLAFCIALVACMWVILQIDSWATFLYGLLFWKWFESDVDPENERYFVAQRITVIRRRGFTRAINFVREGVSMAARRASTLFGGVVGRPSSKRAQPASV